MSRCFRYPPPGYVRNGIRDEALIESIKLQREGEKAKKERKKEKKREKREKEKARENGEVESKKHSHKKRHKDERSKENQKAGELQKRMENEAEQLEKSSLTEERGHPVGSQNSFDSTLNSNKRQKLSSPPDGRHNSGSIIRIRLPLQRPKDSEVLPSKEQPCTTLGRIDEASIQVKHQSTIRPGRKGVECPSSTSEKIRPEVRVSKEKPSLSARECGSSAQKPCVFTGMSGSSAQKPRLFTRVSESSARKPCVSSRVSKSSAQKPRLSTRVPESSIGKPCLSTGVSESSAQKSCGLKKVSESSVQKPCLLTQVAESSAQKPCVLTRVAESSAQKSCPSTGAYESSSQMAEISVPSKLCGSCPPELLMKFRDVIEVWVPPPIPSDLIDIDDQEWLFETKQHQKSEDKRCGSDSASLRHENSPAWPRVCYLPEADVYALPFTVPF